MTNLLPFPFCLLNLNHTMLFTFKDTYRSFSKPTPTACYLRTAGGANSEASPLTLPRTDGVGTRLAYHAACCSSPKLAFLPLNQRGSFSQAPRAIIYGQKTSAEGKGGPGLCILHAKLWSLHLHPYPSSPHSLALLRKHASSAFCLHIFLKRAE